MGYLRFRRSIRIAPGIKLNLGKRGISASVGVRGAQETFHISGRRLTSVSIPGTGISYISRSGGRSRARPAGDRRYARQPAARAPGQPAEIPLAGAALAAALPKPGLFASSTEKRYHEGVNGNPAAALAQFEQVTAEDPQCVSAQLMAAVCALSLGDRGRGIKHLEAVVQAPIALPDTFAAR